MHVALYNTKNNPQLARAFQKQFEEMSGHLKLSHMEGSFYRCASMHMDYRWSYDHEYFQRMIERHCKLNNKVIGCIMTGMSLLINDNSSSDDGSMPSLHSREECDSSSDSEVESCCDDDGVYDDGEF